MWQIKLVLVRHISIQRFVLPVSHFSPSSFSLSLCAVLSGGVEERQEIPGPLAVNKLVTGSSVALPEVNGMDNADFAGIGAASGWNDESGDVDSDAWVGGDGGGGAGGGGEGERHENCNEELPNCLRKF